MALHLQFSDKEMRFSHLKQILFLQPGEHEFAVDVKLGFLRGRGGLKWMVRCAGEGSALLGSSNKLIGTGKWETVKFQFTVPKERECEGQFLRLESTGKHTFDHKLEGNIWFDKVIIKRVR